MQCLMNSDERFLGGDERSESPRFAECERGASAEFDHHSVAEGGTEAVTEPWFDCGDGFQIHDL